MSSDSEKVKITRRLQRLHEKASVLIGKLEEIDPNAAGDIIDQCFGVAWPEHVMRHYIDQVKWDFTETGIKRRKSQ